MRDCIHGCRNPPRTINYELDNDPSVSAEETAFNAGAYRATPAVDAHALRSDGLRWMPVINGELDIPVLTLHAR